MDENKDTNYLGLIAEIEVMREAHKRGYIVSQPMSKCSYDLIIDNGKPGFGHKLSIVGMSEMAQHV